MKQIQTWTSTYTADVSGVPSALYELGGMIIMHDASGCNSTYNTHDEPRWYGSKSLVFISGLTEMEAIMGDDRKLVDDIIKASRELKPRFIAIAGTPIPMITGCDIEAIARVIEKETNIPTFGINTNGMHSYIEGAGEALLQYAKIFVKKDYTKLKRTVNILGATPIDFSVNGQIQSIKSFLESNGYKVISNFALDCDIKEIENAGKAVANIVVSSVGIKIADYFNKEFNTPYIVGLPYGNQMKKEIISHLDNIETIYENSILTNTNISDEDNNISVGAKHSELDIVFTTDISKNYKNNDIYIIGESVTSKSLAKAIYNKYGFTPTVICPVELGNTFHGDIVKELSIRKNVALESQDYNVFDEDEIAALIKNSKMVIADPLYKAIVPKKAIFVSNPHEGFSGRLYRKDILNPVEIF